MKAIFDSSVVLRIVLGQSGALRDWRRIQRAAASALVEVECLRTLDRLRIARAMDDDALASRRAAVLRFLERVDVVLPSAAILSRASSPFPTALGTLDAIHLATALLWRQQREPDALLATHDAALARAARACGVEVVGA
jgi:predicted nucleic acid-binding protein